MVQAQLLNNDMINKSEEQIIHMYDLDPSDTRYADECLHLPNDIDFVTEIHTGDEIIRQYNCHGCGKIVQNIYAYTETRKK